jgi:flagellar hook assembly protein FlgD
VNSLALDHRRGPQAFTWDGTTSTGAAAPAGAYKIEVVAKVGDQNVSLRTSVAANVSSVALDPATGSLLLDTDSLGELALSRVERVL